MGGYCCKIERLANGFEVEMTDPAIVKANRTSGPNRSWRSPEVSYAFKTVGEVVKFLEKNLDKAVSDDEYGSTFDVAASKDDD